MGLLGGYNQWYINNIDKLELFIDYFNNKLFDSKELNYAHQITFPIENSDQCHIETINEATKSQNSDFIEKITNIYFTPRQIQCLKLIIKGCSAKQIARELNISYRTVEDHINSIKTKLHAQNKTDLIIKIWRYLKSIY